MHGAEALRIHREVLATKGPVFSLRGSDRRSSGRLRLPAGQRRRLNAGTRLGNFRRGGHGTLYDDVFELHGNDVAENSVVRQVTDYIGAHLHLPLPVDELARLSGLSRAHFSRVFAAHEGIPPAEFVLNRRLDRAPQSYSPCPPTFR